MQPDGLLSAVDPGLWRERGDQIVGLHGGVTGIVSVLTRVMCVCAVVSIALTLPPVSHADALHPATFKASISPADPRPGEYAEVKVHAAIAPGWHLYSLVPTPPPGPTVTTLTVSGDGLSSADPPAEDTPVTKLDPNFGKAVAYHLNHAAFTVPIQIASSATSGSISAQVVVHYQTCNDTVCLPPTAIMLPLEIQVSAGPVRAQYAHAPAVAAPRAVVAASPAKVLTTEPAGLLPFIAAAFGAGLLALLTPCVFPLIPVTFGYFTKQVGGERRRLIALAGTYSLGIIVSFTLLGLIAALTFGAAGANRVAANPWFNLFFGILFVAFAFSFFESFIIQLPPVLSRFASPTRSGGTMGVLLMGLAFVFAAFTCTAPFIGTILVTAASATGAEWLRPLIGMVFFALALALPFFLLALFPSLLSKLPRSGGWLTQFKAALGFLELAYALTYFSKADLVWQTHLLTRPVVFALWAAIAIACALYLLGLLRVAAYPEEPTKITPGRWVWAGVFAVSAVYCLYALTGRPVNSLILAYLPPADYAAGASRAATGLTIADDADWLSNLDQGVAQAKAAGKPIFVDFTGYTCTNCRYVELNTFPKPPVDDLLTNHFVRVRLYTDGGKDGAANQALQQKMFGTVALPLYAVVSADGKALSSLSGSGSTVQQFADFMTHAEQLASADLGTAPALNTPTSAQSQTSWANYSPSALSTAKAAGRPVIIDFTASWCTNCHALEKHVFTAPQVATGLGRFTTLRADLTDFYGANNAVLEKQYGVLQLPAIVFLDSSGKEVPGTRVTGLVPAEDFAGRMAKVNGAT